MRTTFSVTSNHEIVSAIRPRLEPHQLVVGAALYLAKPFATEDGIIPAGAKGFVEHVHEPDGTVTVLMEGIEPALYHWHNQLVLCPFTTDDVVACIKLSVDKKPTSKHVSVPKEGTNECRW